MAKILSAPLEDQPAMWNDLDKTIAETWFPQFTWGFYGDAMMRGSNVNNFENDSVFGMPTWKDIWLTQ
jgi:peptide/nickel transport system substrate-binding protein